MLSCVRACLWDDNSDDNGSGSDDDESICEWMRMYNMYIRTYSIRISLLYGSTEHISRIENKRLNTFIYMLMRDGSTEYYTQGARASIRASVCVYLHELQQHSMCTQMCSPHTHARIQSTKNWWTASVQDIEQRQTHSVCTPHRHIDT